MSTSAAGEAAGEVKILRLRSGDNQVFNVEERIAMQSDTLKHMTEDGCSDDEIPLPVVDGKTLALVVEWCNKHPPGVAADSDLKKWELEFINVDQEQLYHLMMAANYLGISELLDKAADQVVSMIKGKTVDEIRRCFNIKNDFTPLEEKKIRSDHPWAFDD